MRFFLKGIVLVGAFLGAMYLMQQVPWREMLKLDRAKDATDEKIGDLLWDFIKSSEKEVSDSVVVNVVDSIFVKICESNNINRHQYKIHIIENNEVNAFAIPGDRIIIHTGLISDCKNESEFTGVLSHELAHLELKHVTKKLAKEFGFAVLIEMTSGGGGKIIREVFKVLSSTAYDRSLEEEADLKAIEYMSSAGFDSKEFGNFMYRISEADQSDSSIMDWLSTHPDSKERAEYIIKNSPSKTERKILITQPDWELMVKRLD
ncbi:MAG: M48 family metallopeptidase, partial [Bacteroidota bacterium]